MAEVSRMKLYKPEYYRGFAIQREELSTNKLTYVLWGHVEKLPTYGRSRRYCGNFPTRKAARAHVDDLMPSRKPVKEA